MNILSVRYIERCSTALHLADKKREVYIVRSYKVRLIVEDEVVNKWDKLIELRFGKYLSLELYREVWLRTRFCQKKGVILLFISTLN